MKILAHSPKKLHQNLRRQFPTGITNHSDCSDKHPKHRTSNSKARIYVPKDAHSHTTTYTLTHKQPKSVTYAEISVIFCTCVQP